MGQGKRWVYFCGGWIPKAREGRVPKHFLISILARFVKYFLVNFRTVLKVQAIHGFSCFALRVKKKHGALMFQRDSRNNRKIFYDSLCEKK